MPYLQMRFFGEFAILAGGEQVSTLTKPRLQSLLAYLILHRESPQFRHHLAGLFYPESTEAQALTNLRNLLYQLRQALPDGEQLIRADNQAIQWNPEIPVSLDVFEFQHMALQETPQNLPLESLESSVNLYQGDLLPGCYDEWITLEREHYLQVFLTLLSQLTERYESLRRYPDAIAACRRLVAADPLHKNGYPRLVGLLAMNGEAPAALKVYHKYARLLKHELDIEPPAELQALYQYTRRTARQVEPGKVFSTPGMLAGQLPLVDRHAEWQVLRAVWKIAAAGQPRMLVICGEAGIGKTRLAEELMGWAARLGIRSAAAHCYASEGGLPYAPVVEWLRALGLPPLERVWQSELSRLLPELLKDGTKQPPPLTEAWQRLRLFEALARAILGLRQKTSVRQQTLLLIEDLHWCDQDTLEWLHYLLRFEPRAPLLIVGTIRSEEAETNPAFQKLILDLRQEGGLLSEGKIFDIELGRLNEDETSQLATHAAGRTLERGLGALIYRETEGNPLFIVETVRAELFKQQRGPGVQPLPYKSRTVLENRIHQLSPGSRELVLLAATIGRSFSLEVLRRAGSFTETELIERLEELLHRRIVREVAPNTFDFSHDKLRQAAMAEASTAHQQLLHRQVADVLADLSRQNLEDKSGEIARHYEQAGSIEEAIQYYQAAAKAAREIFANELSIQYYRRAIGLMEGLQSPTTGSANAPDRLAGLQENLGEMLALDGKFPQAQDAFEQALAQPFPAEGIWRAQVYRKISAALIQEYRRPEALAALDHAEQALNLSSREGTLPEKQEWIQIQLARSDVLYWENQPEQMDAIHQKIQALVETAGRPNQQVELFSQQLMARMRHEHYRLSPGTIAIAQRKMELVNTLNVPYDIAWAQFHMGFALLWHGEPAAARVWIKKAYEAAVRMAASLLQVRSLAYLCITSRQLKDEPALRDECMRLFELSSAIGELAYHGISLANQGWLAWRAGDPCSAEQRCSSAKEIWKRSGGYMFEWLADWVLLAIAVAERNQAAAEQHAQALLNPTPLAQPILAPVARMVEEALGACQAGGTEIAFQRFNQALEMAKDSGDL